MSRSHVIFGCIFFVVFGILMACTGRADPPSKYTTISVDIKDRYSDAKITVVPMPEKATTCYIATESGHGIALQCLKD